jgi:hypothetical protein
MYNPDEIHTPVKDGCVISPLIYNPETFTPIKSITITWDPESIQDRYAFNDQIYRNENDFIYEKLEKMLKNPEEYEYKGYVGCLIRFQVD